MQLPDFIKKALAFFEKAEANLTAEEQLAKALAKVTELEGTIAGHVKTIGERDAKIVELQGKLTEAEKAAGEQAVQITNLNGKVETEKNRANATLAAQGLLPQDLPKGDANGNPASAKKTAWATYCELRASNPVAAGEYYESHAEEILKTRN